jgi:hypothetical protein
MDRMAASVAAMDSTAAVKSDLSCAMLASSRPAYAASDGRVPPVVPPVVPLAVPLEAQLAAMPGSSSTANARYLKCMQAGWRMDFICLLPL